MHMACGNYTSDQVYEMQSFTTFYESKRGGGVRRREKKREKSERGNEKNKEKGEGRKRERKGERHKERVGKGEKGWYR